MCNSSRTVMSALRGAGSGSDSGSHSSLHTFVSSVRVLPPGNGGAALPCQSARIRP